MLSLLARLRRKTHHSAGDVSQDPSHSTSIHVSSIIPANVLSSPNDEPLIPSVNRRIVEDIASLLEACPETESTHRGLKPPRTRKRSVIGVGTIRSQTHESSTSSIYRSRNNASSPLASSVKDSPRVSELVTESSPMTPGDPRSQLPQLASISPWSTFGRDKPLASPILGQHDFSGPATHPDDAQLYGPRRSLSNRDRRSQIGRAPSISTNYHGSTALASSDAIPCQSDLPSPSRKSSELADDDDSPSPPATSHGSSHHNSAPSPRIDSRALTPHSSRSSCSHPVSDSVGVAETQGSDSPRTFGRHSRRHTSTSSRHRSMAASFSPPLPPLNHPELLSTLLSRSQSRKNYHATSNQWRYILPFTAADRCIWLWPPLAQIFEPVET
ncbi:hypothetical protein BKA93DRAFT_295023 [Sparassis latifolia]